MTEWYIFGWVFIGMLVALTVGSYFFLDRKIK